jgi:hypothetical protein
MLRPMSAQSRDLESVAPAPLPAVFLRCPQSMRSHLPSYGRSFAATDQSLQRHALTAVQNLHRFACLGISLRHSGQALVVGSGVFFTFAIK